MTTALSAAPTPWHARSCPGWNLSWDMGRPGRACHDVFGLPFQALFDAAGRADATLDVALRGGLRLRALATRSQHGGTQGDVHCASGVPMRQMQASMIRQAMEQAAGNVTDAARALGISRATRCTANWAAKTAEPPVGTSSPRGEKPRLAARAPRFTSCSGMVSMLSCTSTCWHGTPSRHASPCPSWPFSWPVFGLVVLRQL